MYPVEVTAKRKLTDNEKQKIKAFGLEWDGCTFSGSLKERQVRKIEKFCKRKHFTLKITNALGMRRADYRKIYFLHNKPAFNDQYICAYCGKWLNKDKVTVDHIYPIGAVASSLRLQQKLIRQGIKNINDPKNLVSACIDCNQRKSKRLGSWVFRGKIGRYKWLWILRYILRAILVVVCIWLGYMIISGQISFSSALLK